MTNRWRGVLICLWVASGCGLSPSSRRGEFLDLCDLASDRTITTVQSGKFERWGGRETIVLVHDINGQRTETNFPATSAELRVDSVLTGGAEARVWLGDRVLLNGDSHYGNLHTSPTGVIFVRTFGEKLLVPSEGFFAVGSDGLYRNQGRYGAGVTFAELELALTSYAKGSACPHDATQLRFDEQFEP